MGVWAYLNEVNLTSYRIDATAQCNSGNFEDIYMYLNFKLM